MAGFKGLARRCNWAGGRYSPREIAIARRRAGTPPACRQTKGSYRCSFRPRSRKARCSAGSRRRRRHADVAAAVRLIFVIMYFLILRPQQKRVKSTRMVKNVRRGDTVITNGGLVGKVTKVIDDEQIEIEIADDVRIRQMRTMLHRRPRQGRAGERRGRGRLISRPAAIVTELGRHALFYALEGRSDRAHGIVHLPVRGS